MSELVSAQIPSPRRFLSKVAPEDNLIAGASRSGISEHENLSPASRVKEFSCYDDGLYGKGRSRPLNFEKGLMT